MLRRVPLLTVLFVLACGGPPPAAESDGGGDTDGGPVSGDAGGVDGGHTNSDGGHQTTDGGHQTEPDGGVVTTPDAGTTISLDMFELTGTVKTGQPWPLDTATVQLLTPYVTVQPNGRAHHAFDNRSGGLGCYADHYSPGESPDDDVDDGTISMTGYHGGTLVSSNFPAPHAANKIVCKKFSGNYVCSFDPFSASAPVATQPFNSGQGPLGNGSITFTNNNTGGFANFTVDGAQTKTANGSSLGSLHISASQNLTINYSCSGCSNSMVLVTMGATRNTGTGVPGASASYGAVTCAAAAGSSITIPKEAIAAMLDNDSALKSVFTSVVVADPPATPPLDADGNPINVLVGRGTFGISTL